MMFGWSYKFIAFHFWLTKVEQDIYENLAGRQSASRKRQKHQMLHSFGARLRICIKVLTDLQCPWECWSHWRAFASHRRPCGSCEAPWRHAAHPSLCARTFSPRQRRLYKVRHEQIQQRSYNHAAHRKASLHARAHRQTENLSLTGSKHLADSVEVSQFALRATDEVRRTETLMPLVLDLHCLSVAGCGQAIKCVISGESGKEIYLSLENNLPWTIWTLKLLIYFKLFILIKFSKGS